MKKITLFSKKNSTIFFHILTKCNLKCYHCYINPKQHGLESLDLKTVKSWLQIFVKKNTNPDIVFLGGEPTLHDELYLMIKEARGLGYKSITVDTNGYRIKDLLNNIELEDVDLFSFSLDGPTAKINDMLRGPGSYECCIKAINETKKKGFKTSLIFTASTANFNYLNQMPMLLSKLSIDHFFIQVIGIRGKCATDQKGNFEFKQVDKKLWSENIPRVAQKSINYGISVTYPKVFLDPDEIFECAGLITKNYFVFPNGRVYRCPLCEDYPLHSKEIKKGNLINKSGLNETSLFSLNIPEGCVMNKIIQPNNIIYDKKGKIEHKIACCMLKEKLTL